MTFEEQVAQHAQKAILHLISSGNWVQPDYANRVKIPKDLIDRVWSIVDQDALILKLKARIEQELADRIVNAMAAEIATDIKQVLSVKERREAIRHLARTHLDAIMQAGAREEG